jgi:hypothetical protein
MKRLYFTIVRFFLGEKAFNPEFNETVRRCTDKLNAFLSSSSGAMFLSIMETQRGRRFCISIFELSPAQAPARYQACCHLQTNTFANRYTQE